jgi:putative flippase GtrA
MSKQGIIGAGSGKGASATTTLEPGPAAPQRVSVLRLLRFAAVGGTVMLAFMGLNAFFGRWFAPQPAFLMAYVPAVLLHFCVNKWWTFTDRTPVDARQVREYLVASLITFLIQWPIFTLAHVVVGMPGWLAAGVANAAQMVVSFVLLQWRVFAVRRSAVVAAPHEE